jgi:hypothetical protein
MRLRSVVVALTALMFVNISYAGLLAYWDFEEGSGTVLHDKSGNGNNGTVFGATWTAGHSGTALSFNGNSDYVSVPRSASLEPAKAITVCVWAYITGASTANFLDILRKADNNTPGYMLRWKHFNDTLQFRLDRATAPTTDRVVDVQSNTVYYNNWHFFVATFDSSTHCACLYVDAVRKATDSSFTRRNLQHSGDLYLMGVPSISTQGYLQGKLDEIRIYDSALSPSEVQLLYTTSTSTRINRSISSAALRIAFDVGKEQQDYFYSFSGRLIKRLTPGIYSKSELENGLYLSKKQTYR